MRFLGALVAAAASLSIANAQQAAYGQCGGIGWTGATTCVSGWTCVYSNDWYSQCLQGTATTIATTTQAIVTTTSTTSTTKATTTATTTTTASGSTRTSPPSGCLVIRTSPGSGEYGSLTAALSKLGTSSTASACIFVYGGTYTGTAVVSYKGPLTIYGYTTSTGNSNNNKVLFTHDSTGNTAGLDGSATIQVTSTNFRMYNINVANTQASGQAVALEANGDKQSYYGCKISGRQDTLYVKSGRLYFSNCYIEGTVDYIFGAGIAWFGECTISSLAAGAVTAAWREYSTELNWIVIDHSSVIAGVSGIVAQVSLGRPWRGLARVTYQYCALSDVIMAKGWTEMAAGATPLFYEYKNTGAGSDTSARMYMTVPSSAVTKSQIWSGDAGWYDTSY